MLASGGADGALVLWAMDSATSAASIGSSTSVTTVKEIPPKVAIAKVSCCSMTAANAHAVDNADGAFEMPACNGNMSAMLAFLWPPLKLSPLPLRYTFAFLPSPRVHPSLQAHGHCCI